MKWLKTVCALTMLALWLPATSHGLLEQAGWIHIAHADGEDASGTESGHDAADGICLVASNDVHAPQPEWSGPPLPLALVKFSIVPFALLGASQAAPNGPDPPGTTPPEFSHRWQFSYRTALSPRAPSLIS